MELTKAMMTNVALIDEQHKELFNRLNAVSAMGLKSVSKEETEKTIDFLGSYIRKHFGDEEKLQRECGYPKYEWHKQQHEFYIGEFNKLKAEYAKNGPSMAFSIQLNNSIIGWIVHHIQSVDVELGKFYNEHKK